MGAVHLSMLWGLVGKVWLPVLLALVLIGASRWLPRMLRKRAYRSGWMR